jgi:hypothetical protein
MAITANTIDHVTLEHLVEAGAVRGANIVGQPGGWGVVIQYGMTERALAAKRGAVRIFRKFETLVGYLKGIGIASYQVDASHFDPVALNRAHAHRFSREAEGRTRSRRLQRLADQRSSRGHRRPPAKHSS